MNKEKLVLSNILFDKKINPLIKIKRVEFLSACTDKKEETNRNWYKWEAT